LDGKGARIETSTGDDDTWKGANGRVAGEGMSFVVEVTETYNDPIR
jgi:hypothetical protein